MIAHLRADAPAQLTDLDRLDRLHAVVDGDVATITMPAWCRVDDDGDHIWLDVAACRSIGTAAHGEDWGADYDAMIAYAASKGWLDSAGTHVRAHIEHADPAH